AALASGNPPVPPNSVGADAAAIAGDRAIRSVAARGAFRAGTQSRPHGGLGRGAPHPSVGRPLPGGEGAHRARPRIAAKAGGDAAADGRTGAEAAARRASWRGVGRGGAASSEGGL